MNKRKRLSIVSKLWKNAKGVEENSKDYYVNLRDKFDDMITSFLRKRKAADYISNYELRKLKNLAEDAMTLGIKNNDIALQRKAANLLKRVKVKKEENLLFEVEYDVAKFTSETNDEIKKMLYDTVTDAYLQGVYLIKDSRPRGYEIRSSAIKDAQRVKLIDSDTTGAKPEQFLQDRKQTYYRQIQKDMVRTLRTHRNPRKATESLHKFTNRQSGYTQTLIRNLMSEAINYGLLTSYSDNEVERYIFYAILDAVTTAVCESMDSTVHYVEDAVVGENLPPLEPPVHPCRSFIAPFYGEY